MDLISAGSVPGLLSAISILMAFHLVTKIGEFLWHVQKQKSEVTETGIENLSSAVRQNTAATEKLEGRIETLEHTIADINRVRKDMRHLFAAVKIVAGEKWPEVRQAMADEDSLV